MRNSVKISSVLNFRKIFRKSWNFSQRIFLSYNKEIFCIVSYYVKISWKNSQRLYLYIKLIIMRILSHLLLINKSHQKYSNSVKIMPQRHVDPPNSSFFFSFFYLSIIGTSLKFSQI